MKKIISNENKLTINGNFDPKLSYKVNSLLLKRNRASPNDNTSIFDTLAVDKSIKSVSKGGSSCKMHVFGESNTRMLCLKNYLSSFYSMDTQQDKNICTKRNRKSSRKKTSIIQRNLDVESLKLMALSTATVTKLI